jgi:hypothetical protein
MNPLALSPNSELHILKAFTNQLFGFGVVAAMHIYLKVTPFTLHT